MAHSCSSLWAHYIHISKPGSLIDMHGTGPARRFPSDSWLGHYRYLWAVVLCHYHYQHLKLGDSPLPQHRSFPPSPFSSLPCSCAFPAREFTNTRDGAQAPPLNKRPRPAPAPCPPPPRNPANSSAKRRPRRNSRCECECGMRLRDATAGALVTSAGHGRRAINRSPPTHQASPPAYHTPIILIAICTALSSAISNSLPLASPRRRSHPRLPAASLFDALSSGRNQSTIDQYNRPNHDGARNANSPWRERRVMPWEFFELLRSSRFFPLFMDCSFLPTPLQDGTTAARKCCIHPAWRTRGGRHGHRHAHAVHGCYSRRQVRQVLLRSALARGKMCSARLRASASELCRIRLRCCQSWGLARSWGESLQVGPHREGGALSIQCHAWVERKEMQVVAGSGLGFFFFVRLGWLGILFSCCWHAAQRRLAALGHGSGSSNEQRATAGNSRQQQEAGARGAVLGRGRSHE